MVKGLNAALDYIPQWLEFQMRQHEQPGCVIATAGLEQTFPDMPLPKGLALASGHSSKLATYYPWAAR